MAAPKIKSRRRNECLELGSESVTISRDLLFLTMRRAVEEALLAGKTLPNLPAEAVRANAQGRASQAVDDLLHKGGGRPELL